MEILHNMAHALLDWETIDKFQLDVLLSGKKLAPPKPEALPPADENTQPEPINLEPGRETPVAGNLALS
jgi:cell division protease FtsH